MLLKLFGQAGDDLLHDGITLAADTPGVIRDAAGVPVEWTLLKVGDNPIVRCGVAGSLSLSAEDMQSILGYFGAKGEQIPVDSNHYLHQLATSKHLDEAEVLKLLPSGVAAMGYGSLALAGDELRFRVNWTPTAYELMKAKIFRYFSPALRGLLQPPLRITSVAMENEPALNNLDALAASANNRGTPPHNTRRLQMTVLEKALAGLLGRDSIALGAEADASAVAAGVDAKTALFADLRKELNLGDNVDDKMIMVALKGLIAKAGGADGLAAELATVKGKVDELTMSANESKRLALIEQGVREGKIVASTKDLWGKLDYATLSAHLPTAPVIAPPGKVPRENLVPADDIALTAEDKEVCRRFGYTEEEFLAAKKGGK